MRFSIQIAQDVAVQKSLIILSEFKRFMPSKGPAIQAWLLALLVTYSFLCERSQLHCLIGVLFTIESKVASLFNHL